MPADLDGFYLRLGRRIQSLRQQRGLTQEQLGARLAPQVTRASIANVESGKQRLLAHTLVQVAEALGVRLDELLRQDSVAFGEARQHVEAELQERLKLAPDQLSQLTRKLGLIDLDVK